MADGSFAGVLNLLITNRVLFLRMLHLFPQEQTINSHYNMAQPNSQEMMIWLGKKKSHHLHPQTPYQINSNNPELFTILSPFLCILLV